MRKLLAVALLAGTAVLGATSADARQGCGRGYHRGPYGGCRLNAPPARVVIGGPSLVIGTYYSGRGYWDGRRYWRHRDRWNNGWRYR